MRLLTCLFLFIIKVSALASQSDTLNYGNPAVVGIDSSFLHHKLDS